jgi:hypothetical protein
MKPELRAVAMSRRLAIVLLAALVAGCSGLRAYPDRADKNLSVRTELKSGSIMSTVRAALHVHRTNSKCETQYVGTIELTEPLTRIGLPAGELSYLVIRFGSSSLLGASSRTLTFDTLLRARAGHTYDINVGYADDVYDVSIREIGPRSSAKEIPRSDLKACGKARALLREGARATGAAMEMNRNRHDI